MSNSNHFIPYGKHSINEDDIDSIIEVLANRFLTQGDRVSAFEQSLCEYTGSAFATSVNSGTSGLHIACLAAGVGEGDLVWTVPNSFVASANCALYCSARVDFVDIDPNTRNICLEELSHKLRKAEKQNQLPKVLIVVHFAGLSCDMKSVSALCKPYGIVIIEDAAHALGGSYGGKKVGCCQYSDMAVLSFHPVKSITTAEGGAVLSNRADYQDALQIYSKQGVTRDPLKMQGDSHGQWYYQQKVLGFNYRLSDLHAVLGISQIKRLDYFIECRQRLAARYTRELAELPVKLPVETTGACSAWHIYVIELTKHCRAEVYQALNARGIGVNVHYIPIHLQPYYKDLGFQPGDFPIAERFYENALTIPLFPSLTADEQDIVIHSIKEVLT